MFANLESIGYAPVMDLHESTIEGSGYTNTLALSKPKIYLPKILLAERCMKK